MDKSLLLSWNRSKILGLVYLVLGTALLWCAFQVASSAVSSLRFYTYGIVELPTRPTFLVFGALSLLTGILSTALAMRPSRLHTLNLLLNSLIVVVFVLVWASIGRRIDTLGIMAQSLRLATPISLGSMAGILSERSGVVNIAIEGMMLAAACIGFTAALYSQNIWLGLFMAAVGGALMAALHAVLSIRFMVDQIISGTVINILAIGSTGFIRRAFLLNNPRQSGTVLPTWRIPWLSDIPVLGKIFFSHQPLVFTMLILVVVVHVLLFYTRWGLRTRTVGEHPRAADTLGIDVFRVRYTNVVAGGMIAGLGGAWFSLETVGNFEELMTGGKGFIALAAMIFGKWNPFGALGGALLFGFADALQIKLQISGVDIPYQFLGMIPYLVTMVVLAGIVGRAVAPAADGIPYKRD
ncbi:MAG: ABC transporter permease [Proteobacteria bacterium]|nr:ABC transporter permease [Pseudomonadota bacterium]